MAQYPGSKNNIFMRFPPKQRWKNKLLNFLIFKEKSNSSPKALSAPWKIQHLLNKVWKSKTNFQFLKKIYHQNIFYLFLLLCTSIIHRIRQNSTITLYSSVNEQISHISWNIEGFINLELFFRKWTKDLKTIISA